MCIPLFMTSKLPKNAYTLHFFSINRPILTTHPIILTKPVQHSFSIAFPFILVDLSSNPAQFKLFSFFFQKSCCNILPLIKKAVPLHSLSGREAHRIAL